MHSRILTAIHRYEHRRKLTPHHRDIFYKYLAYGGLDVGPNMFQGVSAVDAEGMDKDMAIQATAQTGLPRELQETDGDSSKWVVDFEGVMKSFLSRRVPRCFLIDTEAQATVVTNLLINFMNYLLLHDVCPEYEASILAAKRVCKEATREIWSVRQAALLMPGDFDRACGRLFGADDQLYDDSASWDDWAKGQMTEAEDEARHIVKFAVAGAGTEEQYQLWYDKAMKNDIKVTRIERDIGLEITEIVPPLDEVRDFYWERTRVFQPVGKIYTKKWINPAAPPADLTPEEQEQAKQQEAQPATSLIHPAVIIAEQESRKAGECEYEFLVEEKILHHLAVGMKFEATVRTLNCGICYLDQVFDFYMTIDTFLPNELMLGYKEGDFCNGFSLDEEGKLKFNPADAEEGQKEGADREDPDAIEE